MTLIFGLLACTGGGDDPSVDPSDTGYRGQDDPPLVEDTGDTGDDTGGDDTGGDDTDGDDTGGDDTGSDDTGGEPVEGGFDDFPGTGNHVWLDVTGAIEAELRWSSVDYCDLEDAFDPGLVWIQKTEAGQQLDMHIYREAGGVISEGPREPFYHGAGDIAGRWDVRFVAAPDGEQKWFSNNESSDPCMMFVVEVGATLEYTFECAGLAAGDQTVDVVGQVRCNPS